MKVLVHNLLVAWLFVYSFLVLFPLVCHYKMFFFWVLMYPFYEMVGSLHIVCCNNDAYKNLCNKHTSTTRKGYDRKHIHTFSANFVYISFVGGCVCLYLERNTDFVWSTVVYSHRSIYSRSSSISLSLFVFVAPTHCFFVNCCHYNGWLCVHVTYEHTRRVYCARLFRSRSPFPYLHQMYAHTVLYFVQSN